MGEWKEKAKAIIDKARGKDMDRPVDVGRGTIHEKIGEGKGVAEDVNRDLEPRE